jgi:hypothetical protein
MQVANRFCSLTIWKEMPSEFVEPGHDIVGFYDKRGTVRGETEEREAEHREFRGNHSGSESESGVALFRYDQLHHVG